MENGKKSEPTLSPIQMNLLEDSLRVARRDADKAAGFRVSLHIGGGVPGQKYTFHYDATGDGDVLSEMRCELSHRKVDEKRTRQSKEKFSGLLDRIYKSNLLQLPGEPPGFLPDTIVGHLEISDGENAYRTYFAVDPEQAKVQGRTVPKPLQSVLNAIYKLGSEATGLKSVKP
jgi:hypothetical protein